MKCKARMPESIKTVIDRCLEGKKRTSIRSEALTNIAYLLAMQECGLSDKTIKRVVAKIPDMIDKVSNQLNSNTVTYKQGSKEYVDWRYNRDELHEICRAYGLDFEDNCFDMLEVNLNGWSFVI